MELNRPPNACPCCWVTPENRTSTPAGIEPAAFSLLTVAWAAVDAPPVSLPVTSAVIEADGAWSIRVMLPWVATWLTSATEPSATFVPRPTGSALRESTDVTRAGSSWTYRSIGPPSASWTRVTSAPTSAERTWPATCAAVRPAENALLGSTVTSIWGVALTRSDLTLARSGLAWSAVTTASVAVVTAAGSAPLTMIDRLFELKPPAWLTVTS